jgi:hypothetical protein
LSCHLEHLAEARDQAGDDAGNRLEAVLEAYALICHERHATASHDHQGTDLTALLHRGAAARPLIRDLLIEGVQTGDVRDDVAPDDLASYCLHALTAAGSLTSRAEVRGLVTVTLAGLIVDRRPA